MRISALILESKFSSKNINYRLINNICMINFTVLVSVISARRRMFKILSINLNRGWGPFLDKLNIQKGNTNLPKDSLAKDKLRSQLVYNYCEEQLKNC